MKEKLTSKTFLQFKYLSDPKLSEDGSLLAFIVKSAAYEENGYRSDLYLYEDGECRKLTENQAVGSYAWTPDGDILYLPGKGGNFIFRLSVHGGEPARVLFFDSHGYSDACDERI